MSKPTIALIPSGYKSGTVYSILPNDGTQDFSLNRDTVGTRVRKDGLIEETVDDTPRLDYTNSDCPALLRECQRTNLITYSEDFSEWSATNIVLTEDVVISPDGTTTADKIAGNSVTSQHRVNFTSTNVSGATTFSFFAKSGEYTSCWARIGFSNAYFDLENGVSSQGSGVTSSIENYGNGWYRCIMTKASSSSNEVCRINITTSYLDTSDFLGDNTSGIYLWGAQLEEGVGSTSYIKTEGTTQTRDLDNLECTTTYTVGSEATWYFDFEAYSYDSSFKQLFLIRNGAFTQYLDLISYESGGTYYMRARATVNGGTQDYIIAFGEDAILNFTRNKVAIRLYGSNFEIYVNGTREYTGTASAGKWDVLNGLDIVNDFGASTTAPSYRLYDFRVYDKTMTQSELEELTTL